MKTKKAMAVAQKTAQPMVTSVTTSNAFKPLTPGAEPALRKLRHLFRDEPELERFKSQRAFAELTGISLGSVLIIENQQGNCGPSVRARVASALGLDPTWLAQRYCARKVPVDSRGHLLTLQDLRRRVSRLERRMA